jgi:hypothetical protein
MRPTTWGPGTGRGKRYHLPFPSGPAHALQRRSQPVQWARWLAHIRETLRGGPFDAWPVLCTFFAHPMVSSPFLHGVALPEGCEVCGNRSGA